MLKYYLSDRINSSLRMAFVNFLRGFSLSHAPTTKPKSSTKPPQSSSVSSLSTVSQWVTTNRTTSQPTVTKRPSTSLTISSTQRSPSSGHSQLISSSATATTSREKPPLSSEASSFSHPHERCPLTHRNQRLQDPPSLRPLHRQIPYHCFRKTRGFHTGQSVPPAVVSSLS